MVFRALFRHYRRHPVQALFLLAGIVTAHVLLVGTLLINAQARASYAEGEQLLGSAPIGQIVAAHGRSIDEADYIRLRRSGFDELAPMLRRVVREPGGEALEILGIDAFALPRATQRAPGAESLAAAAGGFAFPPYELWVAPARAEQLGWRTGDRIALGGGKMLPPVQPVGARGLGHRLLLDIGQLQELTASRGELTAIVVFPAGSGRLEALQAALPAGLEYHPVEAGPDPAQLTRSFHLNLAAMGLLAFVVGIFLTYNALAFSYTDRRELLRRLRLSGVTRGELGRALLSELALFLATGTALGYVLGSLIAAALLPGVGRTLAQLYGVYIRYPDTLVPIGLWLPLAMSVIAAAGCVLVPLRQALVAPMLQRQAGAWDHRIVARRDRALLVLGIVCLLAALVAARLAGNLWTALAGMASLLLGAALCLPAVLRLLLTVTAQFVPARRARLCWLIADSRWLLGPAALALMAMSLALVANSGLNTMIGSFRQATDDWLEQRLAAQLYLRGDYDPETLRRWLASAAPQLDLVERYRTTIDVPAPSGQTVNVEVATLPPGPAFIATAGLFRQQAEATAAFASGRGLFISERAARLDGWQLGDSVRPCAAAASQVEVTVEVTGIYRDYGNPQSQWMMNPALFRTCWPAVLPVSRALVGPPATDWAGIRHGLLQDLALDEAQLVDQRELKAVGLEVFDRTFTVTRALNALTLLVAGIGIFCAISAIHHHRVNQQALLASLGLTRLERGALLLLQWSGFGLLSMVLVWPFGTALAGYLSGVVTPVAFGWSFALRPDWQHYPVLALLAVVCLLLAVLLPMTRLLRTPAAVLLREQAL